MKGKSENAAQRKSETRDISSYVCRAMVYGAVSGHGITRERIERLCERYSDENPRIDVTKLPIVMWTDDGEPENRAIVSMIKKNCKKSSISSEDGKTVLLIGTPAREIVSKMELSECNVNRLKTKIRVSCGFPVSKKLKCFGGERVIDHVKPKRKKL